MRSRPNQSIAIKSDRRCAVGLAAAVLAWASRVPRNARARAAVLSPCALSADGALRDPSVTLRPISAISDACLMASKLGAAIAPRPCGAAALALPRFGVGLAPVPPCGGGARPPLPSGQNCMRSRRSSVGVASRRGALASPAVGAAPPCAVAPRHADSALRGVAAAAPAARSQRQPPAVARRAFPASVLGAPSFAGLRFASLRSSPLSLRASPFGGGAPARCASAAGPSSLRGVLAPRSLGARPRLAPSLRSALLRGAGPPAAVPCGARGAALLPRGRGSLAALRLALAVGAFAPPRLLRLSPLV